MKCHTGDFGGLVVVEQDSWMFLHTSGQFGKIFGRGRQQSNTI